MTSKTMTTIFKTNPSMNKDHMKIEHGSTTYKNTREYKKNIILKDNQMISHHNGEETEGTSTQYHNTSKGLENKEMSTQSNDLNSSIKKEFHAPRVNYDIIQTSSSYINQEDYKNSLMNICNQRRSASISHKSCYNNSLTREYDNNAVFLKKKADKINNLRLELSHKEQELCPFKPMIDSYSVRLLQRSKTYNSYEDTYLKTTNWKRRVERKIRHQYTCNVNKSQEQCLFHPLLTDSSIHDRVRKEMKMQKPDYVYQKNIRWLKDVAQRRKEGALEQIEQRMNEQANFRKGNQEAIYRVANSNSERLLIPHKKLKIGLDTGFNNNSNHNTKNIQTEENKESDETLIKIQQFNVLIIDLNNTIQKNKALKKNNLIQPTKNNHIKNSRFTKSQYLMQRYSCNNMNKTTYLYDNNLTLVYNTNNSSLKSIDYIVSKRVKHKIKPKTILNTNRNPYNQYSTSEELNHKYQLLMEKYYNEKQASQQES